MAPNISQLLSQARYRYQDQAKRDLSSAVSFYRNLEPKLDIYVYPDGASKELLALQGTIPVTYRGSTYNIPISMYIPDNYPQSPPLCYVKPTNDMQIKQSKHVDGSGRIYLPYLSDWVAGSSDILGVIQIMIIIFGESPPVYQKPKNQPFSSSDTHASPYPAHGYQPMPRVGNPTSMPSYPGANATPYPTQPTYPYPQYPYPSTNGPQPAYSQAPASVNSYPGSYPRYPNQPLPYPGTTTSPVNSNTGTITQEHIRDSLMSAVMDKIKAKEREKISQTKAEMEVLKKTSHDLENGKRKLEEITRRMENEMIELADTKEKLTEKDNQLKELLSKHESQETQVDIDEAFGPSEPLYKQLVNAFAEENAIQDAIYLLSEALQKGVIDLELFLKNVRELSRKQFMLKALMQTCRTKAGLPL
ncbi:Tumor susceptibility -like protein [Halotydeus destructor]|nr:Tumor susceptibility -like protein [Halotydeus destructor]